MLRLFLCALALASLPAGVFSQGSGAFIELIPRSLDGAAPYLSTLSSQLFDPVGDQYLIWGGAGLIPNATGTTTYVSETLWTVDPKEFPPSYRKLNYNKTGDYPLARTASYSLVQSSPHRLITMFGLSSFGVLNDSWALDLDTLNWQRLPLSGGPSPRGWGSLNWIADEGQPHSDIAVLYGGYDAVTGFDSNETWFYNSTANSWTKLEYTILGDVVDPFDGQIVTAEVPPRAETHGTARVDNRLFLFGGYSCIVNGFLTTQFEPCYVYDMWVLTIDYADLSQSFWHRISRPNQGEQVALWPEPRFYTTLVAYDRKLYQWGGSIYTPAQSYLCYEGLRVFNTDTMLWERVTAYGTAPIARDSTSLTLVMRPYSPFLATRVPELWLFGGTSPNDYLNDLWAIRPAVSAGAADVSVRGLSNLTAGVPSTFTAQITGLDGHPVSWASGLTLQGVVTGSTINGVPTIQKLTAADLGTGEYNFTLTVEQATVYGTCSSTSASSVSLVQVYVEFGSDEIPGSPFSLSMRPAAIEANTTVASGDSLRRAVKDQFVSFFVQLSDRYGNLITSDIDKSRFGVYLIVKGSRTSPALTEFESLGAGRYKLMYFAPEEDSFSLGVTLDGRDISGSPFTVTAVENLDVPASMQAVVIALTTIVFFMIFVFVCLLVYFRQHAAVRAASIRFYSLMLFGCVVGLLSAYMPASPTDSTCMAFPWLLGPAYIIALTSMLVKTWRVTSIFNSKLLQTVIRSDLLLVAIVSGALFLELMFMMIWQLVDPLTVFEVQSSAFVPYPVCKSNHENVWFGITYGDKAVLLVLGVYFSVSSRNLPTLFNESKFIAASIYNIAVCSLLGLVVTLSIQDSPSTVYGVRSLVIIWCIGFTATVLSVPKIYFALTTPNDWKSFEAPEGDKSGAIHTFTRQDTERSQSRKGTDRDTESGKRSRVGSARTAQRPTGARLAYGGNSQLSEYETVPASAPSAVNLLTVSHNDVTRSEASIDMGTPQNTEATEAPPPAATDAAPAQVAFTAPANSTVLTIDNANEPSPDLPAIQPAFDTAPTLPRASSNLSDVAI